MSSNVNANLQRALLEAGLRAARRRLYQQRLAAGLSAGIGAASGFLLIGSVLAVGYMVIRWAGGVEPLIDLRLGYLAAIGVAAIVIACVARAATQTPSVAEVAERVDLAMADHNRIATALDFVCSGVDTPMARAAVADGIVAVSRVNRHPVLDTVQWHGTRRFARIVLGAALWGVAILFLSLGRATAGDDSKTTVVAAADPEQRRGGPASRDADRPRLEKSSTPLQNDSAPTGVSPPMLPIPALLAPARQTPSMGGSSGGATTGNAAGGDPSGGADAKRQMDPTPPPKPSQGKPSLGSGMGGGVQGTAGAVGSGGKGGGGKSLAVENESRRQDAAEMESGEDGGGDPPPPDESNENRHRGGAQPLLQDRAQSPTRELGLGGLKGMPGNGRGGPTPTKKARGAGALLLGVPIPDFVPGKLLAGMSKISRENIRPRRADLPNPPPGEPVPMRSRDENVLERFDVSQQDAAAVLRYLTDLHGDDAESSPVPPAPSPSIPNEETRSR